MKNYTAIYDAKIFTPGDVYILHDNDDRRSRLDTVDFLFMIRCEKDIILALESEKSWVMGNAVKQIMGCTRVSSHCFALKVLVHDTEEGDVVETIYLQRLHTVEEKIIGIKAA